MLLVNNIRLSRIVRNTWHVDLIMIASCMGAYFIREYLIAHHFSVPTIIPTVLGTAIAFFIGFKNKKPPQSQWLKKSNLIISMSSYKFGLFSASLCGMLNK